jgi:hypothetical protein
VRAEGLIERGVADLAAGADGVGGLPAVEVDRRGQQAVGVGLDVAVVLGAQTGDGGQEVLAGLVGVGGGGEREDKAGVVVDAAVHAGGLRGESGGDKGGTGKKNEGGRADHATLQRVRRSNMQRFLGLASELGVHPEQLSDNA